MTDSLDEAVKTYERVILLEPSKARALNNLAWILVTAPDEQLKDKERALVLAKKAADLNRSPHILDTLAEAYYANGLTRLAIKTIKEALSLTTENRRYYESQLKKFMTDEDQK